MLSPGSQEPVRRVLSGLEVRWSSGRHGVDCGERFERDRAALLPLPTASYEACEKIAACVSSLALVVGYSGNDYSVPTPHRQLQVRVKGYVHEVTIACVSEVIARHPRYLQPLKR